MRSCFNFLFQSLVSAYTWNDFSSILTKYEDMTGSFDVVIVNLECLGLNSVEFEICMAKLSLLLVQVFFDTFAFVFFNF